MASKTEHSRKAEENEGLIKPLERLDSHPDWVITVKFYAAVHWLRALMAHHGDGAGPREEIHYNQFSSYIERYGKANGDHQDAIDDALDAFQDLRDWSVSARYMCLRRTEYDGIMYELDRALLTVRAFVGRHGIQCPPLTL